MSDSVQEKFLSPFFNHLGVFDKDLTNDLIVFFSHHGMNDSIANNYIKIGFVSLKINEYGHCSIVLFERFKQCGFLEFS